MNADLIAALLSLTLTVKPVTVTAALDIKPITFTAGLTVTAWPVFPKAMHIRTSNIVNLAYEGYPCWVPRGRDWVRGVCWRLKLKGAL